jgi:Zn-dependent M28 family amino/carboxypeptidase
MFRSVTLLCVSAALACAAEPQISPAYQDAARRLIEAALKDEAGMARLQYLCDQIGNRLSGSASLDKAIKWSAEEMKKAGLQNVQLLPVKVPHWVRGAESLAIAGPVSRSLPMLGLGGSIATPPNGITAEVLVVTSFEELAALGADKVRGKIVVYNQPFQGYGETVRYRSSGASQAARLGAVAALVRSITGRTLRTPHTGAMRYEENVPKIPVAAITPEDAQMMARLSRAGVPVKVTLKMEARTEAPADSANVIGEIPGREKPEEVVVLGGHIDSWDVGQGAQDDGSGVMAALAAVALMKELNLQPRRTVRVAFWTNEENGTAGGNGYRDWLGDKVKNHVAAIEMDGGAEKPVGFGVGSSAGRRRAVAPGAAPTTPARPPVKDLSAAAMARLGEIAKLLAPIDAGKISLGGGGADIAPIMALGVPGLGLQTTSEHYNDWHHTEADTFDKVNPEHFRQNVAALAVMAYVLADMPERLTDLQ